MSKVFKTDRQWDIEIKRVDDLFYITEKHSGGGESVAVIPEEILVSVIANLIHLRGEYEASKRGDNG